MSYVERIAACNNAQLERFLPFYVAGQVYGYILPNFAQHLATYPAVFQVTSQRITLNPNLHTYAERTDAVMHVMQELYQQGVIPSWVGENYPITHEFGGPAEFEVERAATSFLGIRNFGLHLNGLVKTADGIKVWTGTRALCKPLWPGKLDHMVAGGQPVGISIRDNVLKEAQEEANVPAELAKKAEFIKTISYAQQGAHSLDRSTIFVFDLWLPESFIPVNQDGEVDKFELLPLSDIARMTDTTTDFKDNCNLVNIDLLLRLGHINAHHPDYTAITTTLYAKDTH